ncbi:MAG: family 16 glycoside hydrolase [Planctomycetota bacterium]|nr:family 16 glycoside hydrolase [Planctomycetota bacterium]
MIRSSFAVFTAIAVLTSSSCAQDADPTAGTRSSDRRIGVLLIGGANNHDWAWTTPSLQRILKESGRFEVTVTNKPQEALADADKLKQYQAFVLDYNGPRWGADAEANFLAAVRGGTGVAIVHAANNAFNGWKEYEEMVALLWRKGTGHGRFHAFDVTVKDRKHPLTKGMPDMRNHPDELYHRLVNAQNTDYRVLATAHSSKKSGGTGKDEPMILVKKYGKGRVFHTPLGHVWRRALNTRASHADPQFRQLIARGTEWAATGQVTLPAQPPNFLSTKEKGQGFKMIFNGRDLTGWRAYKKTAEQTTGWTVKQGSLVLPNRTRGGDIMTTEQYGNFDLRFEWRVAKGTNSGVIYRIQETKGASYTTGPEYQILDDASNRAGNKHKAGALYDLVPTPKGKQVLPHGAFNTGRIMISKGRVKHWVNGMKVVDCSYGDADWKAKIAGSKFKRWPEFGTHPNGHIAFQDHGGEVWYRSIRIRELKD